MLIIGCDYHPSVQQIAWVDTETGECGERRLLHRAEAERFYRDLKGKQVRVGIEATGHSRWFERLLAELKFELWIGDSAEIRAKRVRSEARFVYIGNRGETHEQACDLSPASAARLTSIGIGLIYPDAK